MADLGNVTKLLEQLKETLSHGAKSEQTVRREALRLSRLLVTSLEDPAEVAFETTYFVRSPKPGDLTMAPPFENL